MNDGKVNKQTLYESPARSGKTIKGIKMVSEYIAEHMVVNKMPEQKTLFPEAGRSRKQ